MNALETAAELIERVRSRPWGLAVVAIDGDQVEYRFDAGQDRIEGTTTFQIGSITKTMTGVLLGLGVVRGELTLEDTLSQVLGVDGPAGDITLLELATQRSGLPRLPPNLDLETIDRTDPYASYGAQDLRDALPTVELGDKAYSYSNFGFMTLAAAMSARAGAPFPQLLAERLFEPLDMGGAGCPPSEAGRIPGYSGASPTPWWTTQLPGAGGVGASTEDLAAYLQAHIDPPSGPLGEAIDIATTVHAPPPSPMGLGWGFQGGGWFHDGGTGGFTSFTAFHRPTRTAVGLLANGGSVPGLDQAGFATLTRLLGSKST